MLDTTHLSAGSGYIKLIGHDGTAFNPTLLSNIRVRLAPADASFTSTFVVFRSTDDGCIYIRYQKTGGGGGGGGGDPTLPPYVVSLDMTPILNTVKSDDLLIINRTNGTTDTYNLSTHSVRINGSDTHVDSVTHTGTTFTVTYTFSPIHSGAHMTATFMPASGNSTSFTAISKTLHGHSVLEFEVPGLPSGTYAIDIASPSSGHNPFYACNIVATLYAYTVPADAPVFTMNQSRTGDGRGITAYATVMIGSTPKPGVDVTFLLANSAGALIGTAQTSATGSDGKTPAVLFESLVNGTYTVTATAADMGIQSGTVTITGGGTDPVDPVTSGGSGGGCDTGFGAFALMAVLLSTRGKKSSTL